MSTPQQQPAPKSPTPSKSSLRRGKGVSTSSQRTLLPPPSPRFEDNTTTAVRYSPRSPPNQTLEYNSDEEDDDEAAEDALIKETADEQDEYRHHEGSYFPITSTQEPRQPFEPLFTLIEDNVTSEHHHPSIHYIFADDDHEIITEAAIRSLEEDELGASSASAREADQEQALDEIHGGRLPAPQPGIKEHYLILDLKPSDDAHPAQSRGQSELRSLSQGPADEFGQQESTQSQPHVDTTSFVVSSFTSLSPDWQIQSATITSAPTISEATSGNDEGLMLRIDGRGFEHLGTSDILATKGRKAGLMANPTTDLNEGASAKEGDSETLDEMIDRFQSNLADIRKLMDINLPVATSRLDGETAEVDDSIGAHQRSFDFEAQD